MCWWTLFRPPPDGSDKVPPPKRRSPAGVFYCDRNVATNPAHIRFFGPDRIVIDPQHIPDMIEQLARPRHWPGKVLFFLSKAVYFHRTNLRKMPAPLLHLQPILEATPRNRQKNSAYYDVRPMRRVIAVFLVTIAFAYAEAREGIPFHTKSPTSTEPVAPERPFTPSRAPFARMLVQRQFRIVTSLEAVDPAVRRLWFKRYPRNEIATGNQEFAETDVSDGKPFRFVLGGQAADSWFILFETGGLAHHHTLVFFQRAGRDTAWSKLRIVLTKEYVRELRGCRKKSQVCTDR